MAKAVQTHSKTSEAMLNLPKPVKFRPLVEKREEIFVLFRIEEKAV